LRLFGIHAMVPLNGKWLLFVIRWFFSMGDVEMGATIPVHLPHIQPIGLP